MISSFRIIQFIKYFFTAFIALGIDYGLFLVLSFFIPAAFAHFISYSVGMVSSFFMQKATVFTQRRKTHHAFGIAVLLWVIGLLSSTWLIDFLSTQTLLMHYLFVAKIITSGFTFWYNYFSRRIAFKD